MSSSNVNFYKAIIYLSHIPYNQNLYCLFYRQCQEESRPSAGSIFKSKPPCQYLRQFFRDAQSQAKVGFIRMGFIRAVEPVENEGAGTAIHDYSGNENNATAVESLTWTAVELPAK